MGGDLVFIYILFIKSAFWAIFINKTSKNLRDFELLIFTSFITSNLIFSLFLTSQNQALNLRNFALNLKRNFPTKSLNLHALLH